MSITDALMLQTMLWLLFSAVLLRSLQVPIRGKFAVIKAAPPASRKSKFMR
jgi:hypothetical protein